MAEAKDRDYIPTWNGRLADIDIFQEDVAICMVGTVRRKRIANCSAAPLLAYCSNYVIRHNSALIRPLEELLH